MSDGKKINTSNFRIESNIIEFNDSLLQISNISQVSVESELNGKFKYWTIILLFFGIIGCIQSIQEIKLLGLLLIVVSVVYILWFLLSYYEEKVKYLCIYLNSGCIYYIYCEDVKFMKNAMKVIKYCINNHTIKKIKIDFDNCKLYNSPIIIGDENKVNECP